MILTLNLIRFYISPFDLGILNRTIICIYKHFRGIESIRKFITLCMCVLFKAFVHFLFYVFGFQLPYSKSCVYLRSYYKLIWFIMKITIFTSFRTASKCVARSSYPLDHRSLAEPSKFLVWGAIWNQFQASLCHSLAL